MSGKCLRESGNRPSNPVPGSVQRPWESPHGRKQQARDAEPWNAQKGKGASSLAWDAHSEVQNSNTDVEVTVIFSKQTLRVIRIYQCKTDSPFRRSSFRTLEHGLCKQVTFLVDLALPRSVQEARTKSPKTAASNRDGGCAPLAQTVFSIAPSFAIFLASHACISVCIFSDLSHRHIVARLIGTQHAFAIKVAVARLRSVAQSRPVLQLAIQIQIPLPLETSLAIPRLSIPPTSSQRPG